MRAFSPDDLSQSDLPRSDLSYSDLLYNGRPHRETACGHRPSVTGPAEAGPSTSMRDHVYFFLNGEPISVAGAAACGMLAPFLRQERSLVGTKIACAQGACGSCSVLVGHWFEGTAPGEGYFYYAPINSCIFPVFNCDGCHVVTVEGVGGPANGSGLAPHELTAVQEAMVNCHAAQCGFCTPGVVIALTAYCENLSGFPITDAASALEGNLCRCTGYSAILEAGAVAEAARGAKLDQRYPAGAIAEALRARASTAFEICAEADGPTSTVFAPLTLEEAVAWKAAHAEAVVIAGGTEIGVAMNTEGYQPRAVLSLGRIRELEELRSEFDNGCETLILGAGTHWAAVADYATAHVPQLAFLLMEWGSPQLREAGTVGGNIVRAAPISDSLPFLLVCEAELEFAGPGGMRRVAIADFLRDRMGLPGSGSDLRANELLRRVHVPIPGGVLSLRKVKKRRAFDRSIVSAAFLLSEEYVENEHGQWERRIASIRIAYGGAGPRALRLPLTEAFLRGKTASVALWRGAAAIAMSEVAPVSSATAGAEYRLQLVGNLLRNFGREQAQQQAAAARGEW